MSIHIAFSQAHQKWKCTMNFLIPQCLLFRFIILDLDQIVRCFHTESETETPPPSPPYASCLFAWLASAFAWGMKTPHMSQGRGSIHVQENLRVFSVPGCGCNLWEFIKVGVCLELLWWDSWFGLVIPPWLKSSPLRWVRLLFLLALVCQQTLWS